MVMRSVTRIALAGLCLFIAGCAAKHPPRTEPVPARGPEVREGLASYYGREFNRRLTASGARFDNRAMMAAHPVYPFGTLVRVTNLANGRSVNVRIEDR